MTPIVSTSKTNYSTLSFRVLISNYITQQTDLQKFVACPIAGPNNPSAFLTDSPNRDTISKTPKPNLWEKQRSERTHTKQPNLYNNNKYIFCFRRRVLSVDLELSSNWSSAIRVQNFLLTTDTRPLLTSDLADHSWVAANHQAATRIGRQSLKSDLCEGSSAGTSDLVAAVSYA